MWTISKTFTFEAAHSLPFVQKGHKCGNIHGHSYEVTISICADKVDPKMGWVEDFGEISAAWKPLSARLDHHYINDVDPDLANPTSELLAEWIGSQLGSSLPNVCEVAVAETRSSCARWRKERLEA